MPSDGSRDRRTKRRTRDEPIVENYRIVTAYTLDNLRAEVIGYIDRGWEPTGGVCYVAPDLIATGAATFCQAMMLRSS